MTYRRIHPFLYDQILPFPSYSSQTAAIYHPFIKIVKIPCPPQNFPFSYKSSIHPKRNQNDFHRRHEWKIATKAMNYEP